VATRSSPLPVATATARSASSVSEPSRSFVGPPMVGADHPAPAPTLADSAAPAPTARLGHAGSARAVRATTAPATSATPVAATSESAGEPEPSLRDAPGPLGDQRPETLARRVVERPREPRLAVDRDASTTRRVPPAPRRHAGQRPADGQVLHQHHHGGS